jgi:hypothetical protein
LGEVYILGEPILHKCEVAPRNTSGVCIWTGMLRISTVFIPGTTSFQAIPKMLVSRNALRFDVLKGCIVSGRSIDMTLANVNEASSIGAPV